MASVGEVLDGKSICICAGSGGVGDVVAHPASAIANSAAVRIGLGRKLKGRIGAPG